MTLPKTATETKTRSKTTRAPAEVRLRWLRDMMLIREFELRTMQAYQEALIGGFCHVYNGQEAIVVGSFAALQEDDPVITAYRDHGHGLARGMEPKYAMAELFGRRGGAAKGKGGSMHFFDARNHFYGGHGIVGGQIPLGVGLAFATKYENEVLGTGTKRVTLAFLGDGALNQGSVHEAMNLAAVLSLPVIVIVENNRYAMGTAIERGTSNAHDLSSKAAPYGMPAFEIDAMDCDVVYEQMQKIVDQVRESQSPAFVVMNAYRFKGHSMSDPQKYRTKEELSEYEAQDPIHRLASSLIDGGDMDEAAFTDLGKTVRAEVRDALKWARKSPEPDPETDLYSDVYVEPYGPYLPTTPPEILGAE
jgi:pyruvate dehydrogenase E1 component alpha subunit